MGEKARNFSKSHSLDVGVEVRIFPSPMAYMKDKSN